MLIQVTAEDIERGKVDHCERCPVALALNRALYPFVVRVGCSVMTANTGGIEAIEWLLPQSVRYWIQNFDNENGVEPFEFELPDSVLERLRNHSLAPG